MAMESEQAARASAADSNVEGSAKLVSTESPDAKAASAFEGLPRMLGRYLLLKRIARGGMGEVFLASTTGIEGAERPVVVKVIRREHAADPSFIARFLDEARVQAQLQHSGVAQVLEASTDDQTGQPYAVVEYVEGRSLGDVRSRAMQIGHSVAWTDAVSMAALIAEALAHVHERRDAAGRALGIVHRDLSPQNVMVSFTGDVKIIDFGTARGQNRRCHTVAGVVFAKPGYVAPEVANGDSGDARVDLYALGIMLWELCASRRFLQGEASVHMAAVARNGRAPEPIAASIGAPAELDLVIANLTAFDRDARCLASRTAAKDLAKLLAEAAPLAGGERGTRARTAALLERLFPGELARSRREFAKLCTSSRDFRASAAGANSTREAQAPASEATISEDGLLAGTRYRLRSEIGRGASSVVYEAEHVDLGRTIALKILEAEQSRSEEFSARFRREARALTRLTHESLVKVHDFGMAADGRLFCGMELLHGETLETFLAREKGVDWREALGIGVKVLRGLEAAHAEGIVHRDLKPANLFLTTDGGLKILDYGLAKCVDDVSVSIHSERIGFTLFGTPEYMAPEQAAAGEVDARADLYALGCVLYEMLSGRLPFVGPSSVAVLDAKVKGSPERPRERAPSRGIPVVVDDLVMRALARHPSARYQTATELREAIEAALSMPMQQRIGRRVLGFAALAASMAFASVLLVGKATQIRAVLPQLHVGELVAMIRPASHAPAAPVAAVEAPPPAVTIVSVKAVEPALAAATPAQAEAPAELAKADEDDDADFVDDTLPGAELAATPAVEVAPVRAPRKRSKSEAPPASHAIHAAVSTSKTSRSPNKLASVPSGKSSGTTPAVEPSTTVDDAPEKGAPSVGGLKGDKAVKARHKKKTRMAKAQSPS